jgi:eukaryotic-like serine/threonine-protein kinase
MALNSGTRVGPYEILAAIGAGGMGEVYRARDTRLERTVAIKILPNRLADRVELRERFEREARTIASLNHPHICTLHDIGQQDGTDYLVMECLEGETLAQRLTKGPLPLEQTLQYAMQIADALDKAHRKGVTHRDLKPGNIMLTRSGAKLLDFGLAKLRQEASPATGVSQLPTVSQPITAQGTIVGTLQYMAPEQLEGKEADARADIFGFGAVVYEMATGKKAFEGNSQASVIAKILEVDPPPISSLQPMTPPALDRAVKKCLAKEPEKRWQDASDLCDELKWIAETRSLAASSASTSGTVRFLSKLSLLFLGVGALLIAAVAGVAVWILKPAPAPPPRPVQRFEIAQPEQNSALAQSFERSLVSVSPDGRLLVFYGAGTKGTGDSGKQLWLRRTDSLEARPLEGTEGADGSPFWSPDSRFIVFGAQGGKLKKLDISTGLVQELCESGGQSLGGFWTPDGKIVFSTIMSGAPDLREVSASGGAASPFPAVERPSGAGDGILSPVLLPDGRHFVYLSGNGSNLRIDLGSLDAVPAQRAAPKVLTQASFLNVGPPAIAFAPSPNNPNLGYLLFTRVEEGSGSGTLLAQPFDLRKLQLTGEPIPVAEGVSFGDFSASLSGVLVYGSSGAPLENGQLTLFDRQGKTAGTVGEPGEYAYVAFSPDGKRVVAERARPDATGANLWMMDLARGIGTRFTFDSGIDYSPVWSPDGNRVAFASFRSGRYGIYQKLSNGGGEDELLMKSDHQTPPLSWSGDGRFLLFDDGPLGTPNASVLPIDKNGGAGKPFHLVQNGVGTDAEFSPGPQGRPLWVAYASNESGRYEIYVRPFDASSPNGVPLGGGKWQVSTEGGVSPRWNGDGKELFYVAPDGTVMSVEVGGSNGVFRSGIPKPLFKPKGLAVVPEPYLVLWDASSDGERFIFSVSQSANAAAPPSHFTVVLNWTSLLTK